ncbi:MULTISPECIES: glycoside hydrolase family 113 [unclassified Streptomyces]|uniref:glycoside hydrolase family 113 n=1 Tax=unclassified Streptomyces TaxID=2593676 RepID=UPI003435C6B5
MRKRESLVNNEKNRKNQKDQDEKKKRSKVPLLAILPVTVTSLVIGLPFVIGDHPLRWRSGSLKPVLVLHDSTPAKGGAAPAPADGGGGAAEETKAAQPAGPALKVDKPWKAGMPEWGVQIFWEDEKEHSDAYVEKQARRQADYLVGLKANAVSVSFPFYTEGRTSTKLTAGKSTPTPEHLETVLRVFHEAGLRTTVRPTLDETVLVPPAGWRGNIKPTDKEAWFDSYEALLGPYLDAAQRRQAATFVIGTELNSMEGHPGWKGLIAAAEKRFKGEVSYDANWDNYVGGHIDVPVKRLGVDAYFPVKVADDAPVDQLVDGWNTWLDKKTKGSLPRIVLAEAGISAMDGAYHAPGDFYARRKLNPAVQANWYKAVCQVVRERKMTGLYWWSVSFDADPKAAPKEEDSRLNFAGRPDSEREIRSCFGSDYAGPGTDPAP